MSDHVRNFKQLIKYELPGLTIKTHKVVMSTDHSHVRFIIKGNKIECDQPFFTTNYQDLLIRSMIVEGVLDRDLIPRKLPKDELKLSNFITNRDDFIYHDISRNLRREFASVLHDECQETFARRRQSTTWTASCLVSIPIGLVGLITSPLPLNSRISTNVGLN